MADCRRSTASRQLGCGGARRRGLLMAWIRAADAGQLVINPLPWCFCRISCRLHTDWCFFDEAMTRVCNDYAGRPLCGRSLGGAFGSAKLGCYWPSGRPWTSALASSSSILPMALGFALTPCQSKRALESEGERHRLEICPGPILYPGEAYALCGIVYLHVAALVKHPLERTGQIERSTWC